MTELTGERRYEQVYGDAFAPYSRREMLEFIEPLQVRFQADGSNARQLFEGKRCLDAACGNGRALFMLQNAVAHAWPAAITQALDPALARLQAACSHRWQALAGAAHVQRELRLQMTKPEPFDRIERITGQVLASGRL